MYTQVLALSVAGLSVDECQTVCDECAAVCNHLAGVAAHQWNLNPKTDLVSGIVKWSDAEAIAMGTETLKTEIAHLREAGQVLQCRAMRCSLADRDPGNYRETRHDAASRGSFPDDDPRG